MNCLCLNGEIKQIREDKIINSLDGWKNKVIKILKIGEDCIIMLDSFGKIFHYNLDKNRLSRISR